jgi:glycosyltransferase involved in cell wall biosynthesis
MTAIPCVSVIIPVHNGAAHLRATVDAILKQTFRDFELLCIDDGSTDESLEILETYNDVRMRIFTQPQRGLCCTLNRGIAEARGPLIARNDQDDVSLPTRLDRQHEYMVKHPEVACVYTNCIKTGARRSRYATIVAPHLEAFELQGAQQECQYASSMFARREVIQKIGGYRQEYYPADDWDLQLRLSEAYVVRVMQEHLVRYRYHSSANTYRTFSRMMENGRWATFNHQRRVLKKSELSRDEFRCTESGFGRKICNSIQGRARLNLRRASQADLDGEPAKAIFYSVLASCFNPAFVLQRARNNFFRLYKSRP